MNRLHPLVHIIICFVFSSLVFILGGYLQLLLICLCSMLYAAKRIKAGLPGALKSLMHSLPLVLSLSVIQLIFNRQGEIYWQFAFLRISSMGVYWAVVFALRLTTVVLCTKALAALDFPLFQAAFSLIRIPEEFSFMLAYGVHLVPMYLGRIKGFVSALRLRGIELSKIKLKKRMYLYKLLAISALVGVISGSTDAAIALELRGFRSKGKRSCLYHSSLRMIDGIALILLAALVGFLVFVI